MEFRRCQATKVLVHCWLNSNMTVALEQFGSFLKTSLDHVSGRKCLTNATLKRKDLSHSNRHTSGWSHRACSQDLMNSAAKPASFFLSLGSYPVGWSHRHLGLPPSHVSNLESPSCTGPEIYPLGDYRSSQFDTLQLNMSVFNITECHKLRSWTAVIFHSRKGQDGQRKAVRAKEIKKKATKIQGNAVHAYC